MNLLLTLTHWLWWLLSPGYRRELRALDQPVLRDHGQEMYDALKASVKADDSQATLVGGQIVRNTHPVTACLGAACCVHNPSQHHMARWRQNWRDDRKLMERVCPHGIGHPDPDHVAHALRSFHAPAAFSALFVHGCDGCCVAARPKPGKD